MHWTGLCWTLIHPTRWKSRERKRQMLCLFIHLCILQSCSPWVITMSNRGVVFTSLPTICQPPRIAGYIDLRQCKNFQGIVQRSSKNRSIERSSALSVKQQSIMEVHSLKGSLVGWILGVPDTECEKMFKKVHCKNNPELWRVADAIDRSRDRCKLHAVDIRGRRLRWRNICLESLTSHPWTTHHKFAQWWTLWSC